MTILVAYAPRPEGQAALEKGIELAKKNSEKLVVINAGATGNADADSLTNNDDIERVEKVLEEEGINAEFKQFVRGHSAPEEIEDLVEMLHVSLLIIGLRRRSAVGKLLFGSVAQELLMTVPCPVLVVKANDWHTD